MKYITILITCLGFSLVIAFCLYRDDNPAWTGGSQGWLLKDKEVTSRLLAVPILLYHNIDGKGPFSIESGALKKQFEMIRDRGIRVVPLSDLMLRLEDPVPYRQRVMVITFDDGYLSMYSRLLPLAREFNFPITLFVYSDNIMTRAKKNLTWRLLREMNRSGIDIQAHSISHVDLTRFSGKNDAGSQKRLYEEIYLSRRVMELYLRKKIDYYAFPYGRYDLNLIDLAYNSGFKRVFSTDYGSNIITRDNFCLRRQHIKNSYSLQHIETMIR